MEKVYQYLKDAKTFFLATTDGDQPHVRPFGAVSSFDGKLYITTNNTKNVYKQMAAGQKIAICAMKDGTWIRIACQVVKDERREAREAMLKENPSLSSMYSLDDGIFEVLWLKDATATIYSFNAEPEFIRF